MDNISARKLPIRRPTHGVAVDISRIAAAPAPVFRPIHPLENPAADSLAASNGVVIAKVRVEMKALAITATRLRKRLRAAVMEALPVTRDIQAGLMKSRSEMSVSPEL
jgi:hypothetical protein